MNHLGKPFAIVLGLALLLAACGGGDAAVTPTDSPTGDTSGGSETTMAEPEAVTTEAPAETAETTAPSAAPSGEENRARVTVGDRQYEFFLEGSMTQCQYFAGAALFGGGFTVDADGDLEAISNADASLTFHLPVADWEAQGLDEPSISVSDKTDDTDWLAGEVSGLNVDPELSKIESWTLDGASASGTAVFVERNSILAGNPQSVPGTFEVSCSIP